MKYMLLIYHEKRSWDTSTEADRQQIYGEYRELIGELSSRGKFVPFVPFCGHKTCVTARA